jgi:hypothetical protein
MALAAGFGCNLKLDVVQPGSRAHTYYLSKYVTKTADARAEVPWIADVCDEDTGELVPMQTDPTFRGWSQSRGFGITVKALKAHYQASAAAAADRLRALELDPSASLADLVPQPVGATGPPI